MKNIKTKLIGKITRFTLKNAFIERILCDLLSNPFIRENLKLKVIAIGCCYVLNKPEIRIANIGEYKLYANIAEPSGISLYFFGFHYEPFAAFLVSKLVNQGDTCIDVGANIGSHTFVMANSTGSDGKVFAFEPQPKLQSLLQESIKLNHADKFIVLDTRALWNKSGQNLKFYLSQDPNNSGVSSLINHGFFVCEDDYIKVETITLSDYFREKRINKCNLIKIDVERAELEVLQGMIDLLEARLIDYIVLEQFAGSESQNILASVGYIGWFIDERKKTLGEIKQIEIEGCGNYLFVSPNLINEFKSNYASLLEL